MPDETGSVPTMAAMVSADDPTARTIAALEREIGHLRDLIAAELRGLSARRKEITGEIDNRIAALEALTDARFVTFRTLIDGESERVKVALDAADKAVTKSEMAVEKRFASEAEKTAAAFHASEQAISKAEASVEKRFDAVNEFRAQLDDQAKTFMPRAESMSMHQANAARAEASFNTLEATIHELKDRMNRNEGKSSGFAASGSLVVACFTVLGILVSVVGGIILIVNN